MGKRTTKKQRRQLILDLLNGEVISSQRTLRARLLDQEVEVNQATLSRDLRDMGVLKVPLSGGGARYVVNTRQESVSVRHEDIIRQLVNRVDSSGNIVLLFTAAGHAQAAALAVDNLMLPGVLGTVAGDDTILLVLEEGTKTGPFVAEMNRLLGLTPIKR